MQTNSQPIDPDFAQSVLRELYVYSRKNRRIAWALWALLGLVGGHRIYLGRSGTGLLMLLTFGGFLVWWIIDAFLLDDMLRSHDAEQDQRRADGRPPLQLAFMPALSEAMLREPPAWTVAWDRRGGVRRRMRLFGDVIVLLIAGSMLGALSGGRGGEEAVFAAVSVIIITLLGGQVGRLDRVPLVRNLIRWTHRLRLFYYYNRPGSPPALLFRPVSGILLAPFRPRVWAEAWLYIQIGAVFTLAFVLWDVFEDVILPFFDIGLSALAPSRLMGIVVSEAVMTFIVIYAFVTPIGAILNLYLLTGPTHTLPRCLGAFSLFTMALGMGILV